MGVDSTFGRRVIYAFQYIQTKACQTGKFIDKIIKRAEIDFLALFSSQELSNTSFFKVL